MNNSSIQIETVVSLIRFQQEHQSLAEKILVEKHCLSRTDTLLLTQKIFQKLSTFNYNMPLINNLIIWKNFHKIAEIEVKILKSQMSKNFGLTETSFTQMCYTLRNGDEQLFEEIFLAHFEECIKYLVNNYTISQEDAYDASMEALLEFRKKLINNKISYGNLRFLFTKMAGQIYIKSQGKLKKVEGISYDSEISYNEEELIVLEKAIEALGEECQKLLKLNFYESMSIADIAEMQDKNAASLRKTKQRCLFKLKNLFTQYTL